jgi:hypothetical protein
MHFNLSKLIPDLRDLEKIAPNDINHKMLLEIIDQIFSEIENLLPPKHSGYYYETLLYEQLYCELAAISPENATKDLNELWTGHEKLFQHFQNKKFTNGKTRRTIPDQPTMSRFECAINKAGLTEKLGNCMMLGQCLYYLKNHPQTEDATLIADFVEEPCAKDKTDPYCYGSKMGKTHHKTLNATMQSLDMESVGTSNSPYSNGNRPFEVLDYLVEGGIAFCSKTPGGEQVPKSSECVCI